MAKEDSILQDKTSPIDREALQEPPLFKVLLHNDDYTTMDFVIMVLVSVFGKNSDEATRIMLNVHHQGIGLAGVYTREVAETKVATVHRLARRHQFPLKCTLEKDCSQVDDHPAPRFNRGGAESFDPHTEDTHHLE